jgi:hypothetical protein
MYIEDLIQFATGSGPYLFKSGVSISDPRDFNVLSSMGDQLLYNGNQLTEKQGLLAVRLLNKYRDELRPFVATLDADLDNPRWKNPFRVLPKHKTVKIGIHNQPAKFHNEKCILVEFPYDNDLVEAFRKRNSSLHDLHKGNWDSNIKKWVFALTETNIEWLGNTLLSKEFQPDTEFVELYQGVVDALDNIESHIPMIVNGNTGYLLKNTHKSVPVIETDNLTEALFLAREYGVTTWDNEIDIQIDKNLHPVTKTILSISDKKHPWIDSNIHSVDVFKDLIQYGGPALVIIPGGSELELLDTWVKFAERQNIESSQLSVMFRLPNEQSAFNEYVRLAGLNNPVSENTRLVFVSTKITKPLIKSGVKFDTVINLGYYNYMHFTMSTVVDNARNLVYYSMKAPTKNNKWQPQEL